MSYQTISLILTLILGTLSFTTSESNLYQGDGKVSFVSEAPLETIKASSDQLKGLLDLSKETFAFSFQVNTFEGFNSPLQKEHFNEHYLETKKYPKSTFVGKLIGWVDCEKDCEQNIIAKGKLNIHGITKIVSIPVEIQQTGDQIKANADFDVSLKDFDIGIPLILQAKISPTIRVTVNLQFEPANE